MYVHVYLCTYVCMDVCVRSGPVRNRKLQFVDGKSKRNKQYAQTSWRCDYVCASY